MKLQPMHFTIFSVVQWIHVLNYVQTSWLIKLSSSVLSNVISFVSSVESKSVLEVFICDKVFCNSFTVVRVVLLVLLVQSWLLYIVTRRLKIEYVISVSTFSMNSSNIIMLMKLLLSSVATYSRNIKEFAIFWSAADRTFSFTLTNSIGSISFMTCLIELIYVPVFLQKQLSLVWLWKN